MPSDSELISQIMQELSQLRRELLDRDSYNRQHTDLKDRVESLEERVQNVETNISNLHNSSMEFVNTSFRDMEHRILDKIEEKSKFSISQWVLIGVGIVGFVGTILVTILK